MSFGLCWPSRYRRYLYRFSTVLPRVVFLPPLCTFVVRFSFVNNLLTDALVGFCPHCVVNLPSGCHRTLLFYLHFLNLLSLIVRLVLAQVVPVLHTFGQRSALNPQICFFGLLSCRWDRPREACFIPQSLLPLGDAPDCFQPPPIIDIFS